MTKRQRDTKVYKAKHAQLRAEIQASQARDASKSARHIQASETFRQTAEIAH